MSYKKQFELNPADIDLIETCLRRELHIRSEECHCRGTEEREKAEKLDESKQRIADITELLGKIHNQKIWYGGNPAEPWVPKG